MIAAVDKLLSKKQGAQKPTIEMKSAEESLGIDSETYNKIVDECIYGDDKQNPTWREEDEHRINRLIAYKMESFCIPRYVIENIQIAIKVFEKERHAPLANALRETMRRLEERWKPTDLQLDCLSDAIERYNSEGYPADVLKTLLRQLKKIG